MKAACEHSEAPVSDAATSLPPPQIHSTLDTAGQSEICFTADATLQLLLLPLTADIIVALNHQLDAEWRNFGTFLRVEYQLMNVIDGINCGRPEDCMLELLDIQTGRNGDPSSHMADYNRCSKEIRIWSLCRKPGTKVQVKLSH